MRLDGAAARRQRVGLRVQGRRAREHPLWPRRHQGRRRSRRSRRSSRSARPRGAYTSLSDLCRRIDLSRVNRRVLEALIRSGSLDGLGANRATLSAELDRSMHARRTEFAARPAPGRSTCSGSARAAGRPACVPEWTDAQRLSGERETLGLFLSGHPITPYEPDLKFLVSARLADIGGPKPAPAPEGRPFVGRCEARDRRRAGAGDPAPRESRDA